MVGIEAGVDQFKTADAMLHDAGLRNLVIVPRTPNVTIAIRQWRDDFAKYRFEWADTLAMHWGSRLLRIDTVENPFWRWKTLHWRR